MELVYAFTDEYGAFGWKLDIPLQLWVELVICTLDEPFRALFAEIIGAETVADED